MSQLYSNKKSEPYTDFYSVLWIMYLNKRAITRFFNSFRELTTKLVTLLNTRKRKIAALELSREWDVLIIGGGASGLGIAVDAASRGLKTVLFEQYDFAKGTSSKSTKLVHGGVRYLAQGNIGLVREALEERGLLAKNAQHLFKNQEFIIPNYNWWGGPYYVAGLKLYDFLSRKLSLGTSKFVSKKDVISRLPTLKTNNLSSGVSYFDGQFDDARLALNLAQTATEKGACVLNYTKVIRLIKDDKGNLKGVLIKDTETEKQYEVFSKVIINATGIFTDKILKMYDPNHKKTVVPSQGIHLMLDASFLDSKTAIMIPKTSDGRVLFIIPWHDKVIVGTTDTLIKKPKIEPIPLSKEVDFILETINAYLTKPASKHDVLSVFSGLRPLAKPKKNETNTKEVSRGHKIIVESNLVSIVGGKWTTYRRMAEDTIDTVMQIFGFDFIPSATRSLPIHGNITNNEILPSEKETIQDHLYIYGSDRESFLDFQTKNEGYEKCIHPEYPYTKGQVIWSVRNEMARTVEDFLSRRIRLLLLDARAAIVSSELVAEIMKEELQQTDAWKEAQISEFNTLAENYLLN